MILQRCLAGYSPWGHKESDMTEWLSAHTHTPPTLSLWLLLCPWMWDIFFIFIFFLVFPNILLLMFVQQLDAILVF